MYEFFRKENISFFFIILTTFVYKISRILTTSIFIIISGSRCWEFQACTGRFMVCKNESRVLIDDLTRIRYNALCSRDSSLQLSC